MAVFPAKPGMFHPAKRQAGWQQIIGVDPRMAAFQLGCDPVAACQIACHQPGAKAKIGGVGPGDGRPLAGPHEKRGDADVSACL